MAIFPGAISTDADLYIAVNNLSTALTDNPLTIGATTVNVASTTGFPTVGTISIGAEIIKYTGKTATSFTGCTRGFDGTSAAAHALNDQVDHNVVAVHHNTAKDEIIAIETHLGVNGANVVHIAGTETITGAKSFSAPTLHADGSAALPGIAFAADPDSGLFRVSADRYQLVANGTVRIDINHAANYVYLIGVTRIDDGTVGAPSLAFNSDTDTGFFASGADAIRATAGGVQILKIYRVSASDLGIQMVDSAASIQNNAGSAALPAYTFSGDTDTGFYTAGTANTIRATVGGTQRMRIDSTGTFLSSQIFASDGTTANPGFAFDLDNNTGIYRRGADELGFVTAGGLAAFFDSSQQLNMQSHKGILLANGTAVADFAAFGQVKILQVVQATATAEVSSTSGTYADTGLTANITPSNAANKVLVIVSQNVRHRLTAQTTAQAGLRLTRNSTDLISDQSSGYTDSDAPSAGSTNGQQIMVYLDSPATTSSTTYKTRISRLAGTGTVYAQDGSTQTAGYITLIEVNGL